jgi:hypothetical protein
VKNYDLTSVPQATPRPKLTAENVVEYLDWIMQNLGPLGAKVAQHMAAAELVIRTRATDAQGKATQHTLVEDGVIEQPGATHG